MVLVKAQFGVLKINLRRKYKLFILQEPLDFQILMIMLFV